MGGYEYGVLRGLNSILGSSGSGAFHVGVEVYGREWTYGCEGGGGKAVQYPRYNVLSGISVCPPRNCGLHLYRESLPMGPTRISEGDLHHKLCKMSLYWKAGNYDLTRNNCLNFADTLLKELGVPGLPPWVARLARAVAPIHHMGDGILPEDE